MLLNKCSNISKVIILLKYIKNNELSLFGQYCPRLKSLSFVIKSKEDLQFGRQYGHKLEELYLFGGNEKIPFLQLCPNVKKVWFSQCSLLFTSDKEFLPKLEYFGSNYSINFRNTNEMKILSHKYSQTMKTLNISLFGCTFDEMKIYFDSISRFENLRELRLALHQTTEPIDDCLPLIGQKCNKLLRFELLFGRSVSISDRFFNTLSEFKAIQTLRIYSRHNTVLKGSIGSLKHCKQLKHLDIDYRELTEDFFANVETFVPNLKFLQILTEKQFSDLFIDSFHSLKSIQKVIYYMFNNTNKTTKTKYWYFGKSLIEVMLSPNGMNVKHITDNCGLLRSN